MTAPANNDRPSERPKPPPPEGCASWLEAAIGMIDPTDMVATGEDTEPVVGGEAINLARAELAEFRAFKAAYDEAIRETVEKACEVLCLRCQRKQKLHEHDFTWWHCDESSKGENWTKCEAACIRVAVRQAFAEPGKEREQAENKTSRVKFVFDERSLESIEKLKEQGRYDVSLEKDPYTVTCVKCSARVHISEAVPETPNPESDPVCHECMEKMVQADTLRQFVDAAVGVADAHMEYPASGHPDDMADTETILRLAPQFREQAP